MNGWKTRPSICTCRSGICMPPSTHSTNLRFAPHRSSNRDDTSTLRGGRCDPRGRQQVPRTRVVALAAGEGARCYRPLPHRCARRSSRSVLQLRPSSHLLQLVSQPTLSQVPDQRSRQVARQAPAGTAACGLLSSGLQRAACACAADVAEQAAALRPAIRDQRSHTAGGRCRSEASWRSVAVLRRVPAAERGQELRSFSAYSVPAGVGRLCQAALRRTRACPSLSGPLYPPGRHLQPSPALGLRLRGHFSLEGLCAQQQAAHHDPLAGGVPAPLPPTCITPRLPAYTLLRLAGQP